MPTDCQTSALPKSRPLLVCANEDCDFATHDSDRWHLHAMTPGHSLIEEHDAARCDVCGKPSTELVVCDEERVRTYRCQKHVNLALCWLETRGRFAQRQTLVSA